MWTYILQLQSNEQHQMSVAYWRSTMALIHNGLIQTVHILMDWFWSSKSPFTQHTNFAMYCMLLKVFNQLQDYNHVHALARSAHRLLAKKSHRWAGLQMQLGHAFLIWHLHLNRRQHPVLNYKHNYVELFRNLFTMPHRLTGSTTRQFMLRNPFWQNYSIKFSCTYDLYI